MQKHEIVRMGPGDVWNAHHLFLLYIMGTEGNTAND